MRTKSEHVSQIDSIFSGGGEMGALMRAFDWSQTPIGAVSRWPQSLRTAVRIILNSRYAMFVWWGRELVNLYNDPYREFLGIKHPAALGKSAREVWAEIWEQIGPRTDAVLLRGESTFDEALLLLMERHGYLEETYFTFSYSPLPDDAGGIGGLFCAVTEATQQVIGERRLRLLREIATATAQCRTPAQVCESAARCLAGAERDLPFTLLYLFGAEGTLERVAEAGIEGGHPAAPARIAMKEQSDAVWPFRTVIETGQAVIVEHLSQRFADLPTGEWDHPPNRAILLPIAQQGQKRLAGVFVAGLNPHRELGDEFKGFLSLLSNQLAAAISNATAFEAERRRAEELAQAPAAIGLLRGPEHCWTYVNDYLVRVTGRKSAQDFIGKTFVESMPEMREQKLAELLDEVYRSGCPYSAQAMSILLNRSNRGEPDQTYFDFVYQPVRNASGHVEDILVHAVEVTDHVLARQALEQSEQELRKNQLRLTLAQQTARIGIFEYDLETNVNRWSPELEAMYGLPPGGFSGTREAWAALVHPDDLPEANRLLEASFQHGAPVQAEWRVIWPDGSIHWILARYQAFKNESGKFVHLTGINIDITEQKQAHEARQSLAAIVESSDDAIVSKDLNGIVTSWNAAAEAMFGYTAKEIIGQSITTIIPREFLADEDRILSTIASGRKIEHFETVRVRKNGERLEVSLTVSPIRNQAGRIIGAAKIARDITASRKAERALRTAERIASVGRLAATVAHEINNPLEAITNLIYLAKRADSQSSANEYLATAEEELERIFHISKQTLGFYRETKGASTVKISTIVTSLLPVFASRTRTKNIQLSAEVKGDTELNVVPGEIRQVVANLISNSIDAVPSGGQIRIRVSAVSAHDGSHTKGVRLAVADNGKGIPREVRTRMFEPFVTSNKDVGTGLGLWISKNIVEAHGGTIRVKSSTTPGASWTVFSVFLPASTAAMADQALTQAV